MNPDYTLALHSSYKDDYRYIIPIQVSGKEDCLLFAVWAQNTKHKNLSYIGQIYLALKHYESLLNPRPFHIDYVFASQYFLNKLEKVEIGKHDAWISHSDHMPIFSSFHP